MHILFSFSFQTFVNGHCGKNYSNFNVVKRSEISATNCSLTTHQIEKALIHHHSLYVYFWHKKFHANLCILRVRDLGFYAHKQFQTSFLVKNSSSSSILKKFVMKKNQLHFFIKTFLG
jgi:Mg2+/Co2+ transporter CorB